MNGLSLSLVVLAVLLLPACPRAETPAAPREVGAPCTAEGVLTLSRHGGGTVGVIAGHDSCVALALPDSVFRDWVKWDRQRVRVSGTGFGQPDIAEVTWFSAKDRKVSAHYCDVGAVIYVDRIEYVGRPPKD